MKYSKEQICQLIYKDYILLIAEELNENGFFTVDNHKYDVGTNYKGDFLSSSSIGFVMSINDHKAIAFLKSIGLLNNGRCPLTGLMIGETSRTTYVSSNNRNITFDVNKEWNKVNKIKRNWGCIIPPFIIIVMLIWGFVDNFSTSIKVIMGISALIFVLSGLYGGSKFGNNWNESCLANQLGLNSISVHRLLNMELIVEGQPYTIQTYKEIAYGDYLEFQRWHKEN